MRHLVPCLGLLLTAACKDPDPQKDGDGNEPPPTETSDHTGTPGTSPHSGDEPEGDLAGFSLELDRAMVLMIHASWTDPGSDDAWVEYRFEGDEWLVAPTIASGEAVILGIPEATTVEAQAVAVVGGQTLRSEVRSITTGSIPNDLLRPAVVSYDPALATPEPYAMISVALGEFTFEGPYAIEIFDRDGRVVWYHEVPDELFSFYPSVAFDGTHLWYDAEDIFRFGSGPPHVQRQTLDGRWTVQLPTPDAGQAYAEGPDDSFFYEQRGGRYGVMQVDAAGVSTMVWNCSAYFATLGLPGSECVLNGCNWDEGRNTLLASQFETSTVFEVDLATNRAVRQFGALDEGDPWTFSPPGSGFAYQHWPHWTPEGTIFVSTHVPCAGGPGCSGNMGLNGTQIAAEYSLDDATQTITRVWSHTTTDRWATQAGEAWRHPSGNFVMGFGQDGAVRELTPDGATAWEFAFPRDRQGYRMVGHVSLIADLYALNRGH